MRSNKNVRSGKDYSGNDWGIVNKDNNFVRPDLLGEGTDWQDEMFSKAMMTSHNLSVTGGSDKVTMHWEQVTSIRMVLLLVQGSGV